MRLRFPFLGLKEKEKKNIGEHGINADNLSDDDDEKDSHNCD